MNKLHDALKRKEDEDDGLAGTGVRGKPKEIVSRVATRLLHFA